jgi:hypothetical protein
MSIVRLVAEGATEAVKLVPLLFTLGVPPAHAQLPRAASLDPRSGPPPMLQPVAGALAPTLVAQHVALTLSDQSSQLRTTSVFRNDTAQPIAARYTLPLGGAVAVRGIDDDLDAAGCGEAADAADDDVADVAQFIEAGEPNPQGLQSGMVWLEPGDEVTLVAQRPADLFKRDTRRRVVIALPVQPDGQPVAQFSAEVEVDAARPIVALASATHGGAVDGLGGSHARLFVPNGRVYEARFLSVDFELGSAEPAPSPHWGNEERQPLAAR